MKININDKIQIDFIKFRKMSFIFNALNNGWSIKKNGEKYIF